MKNVITLLLLCTVFAGCSPAKETHETELPDGSKAKVSASSEGLEVHGENVDGAVGGAAKVTEADLRLKIYPGSQLFNDKSMKVETPSETSVLAYYSSNDDPKKIAEFFEGQLKGQKFQEYSSGESVNYILQVDNSDGSKTAVSIVKKSASEPVEISIGYGKESKK